MAFRRARPSTDGPNLGVRRRLRLVGAATVLVTVAVTVPTVASATPNTAIAPRIHSVQQRLSALARENDQIVEKYNQANIAYHAIQAFADALPVGPILMGAAHPAHILTPSVTPRGIVNMTAIAVVEAQACTGAAPGQEAEAADA